MGAVRLSSVGHNSKTDSSNVSFRHLALLAQTKTDDAQVWQSLSMDESNPPSSVLIDRLKKMRTWINSPHFPDEMRIKIIDETPLELLGELSDDDVLVLANLTRMLDDCEWDVDAIATCIVESAKTIEKSPRIAYTVAYTCLMGNKKGPKLAPIIAELDKPKVIRQFERCLDYLN